MLPTFSKKKRPNGYHFGLSKYNLNPQGITFRFGTLNVGGIRSGSWEHWQGQPFSSHSLLFYEFATCNKTIEDRRQIFVTIYLVRRLWLNDKLRALKRTSKVSGTTLLKCSVVNSKLLFVLICTALMSVQKLNFVLVKVGNTEYNIGFLKLWWLLVLQKVSDCVADFNLRMPNKCYGRRYLALP